MGIDDAIADATGSALDAAASRGDATFLAALIVLLLALLTGGSIFALFKFLLFPMRDAYIERQQEQRQQQLRQTQIIEAMSDGHREMGPIVRAIADGMEEVQQALAELATQYADPLQYSNRTSEHLLRHIQRLIQLSVDAWHAFQQGDAKTAETKLTELRYAANQRPEE